MLHGVGNESSWNDNESTMLSLYAPMAKDNPIRGKASFRCHKLMDRALGLIEAFRISIAPVQKEKEYRKLKKKRK